MMKWVKRIGVLLTGLVMMLGGMVACNSLPQPVQNPSDAALRIATFNVHYIWVDQDTGAWSVGDWDRRKAALQSGFESLHADVVGFQEMESFSRRGATENLTLEWLRANNPDYAAAAVGDPAIFPSTQPIFYRTDRLELRDHGWFFFSDTPDVIYSRTFNGSFPAFASWAEFEDRQSGETFRVYNVHFEYKSRSNRQLSAELVTDRIADITAQMPVFVIGDLNARAGSATMGLIEDAGVTFWPVQGSTYHFNRGLNLFGAIDHIGGSGGITPVGDTFSVRGQFDGEWASDHYPVVGDFTLSPR